MDVWLEWLGWASPEFETFLLAPFSALTIGGSVGNSVPANTAR
jgi:hypothetical protein